MRLNLVLATLMVVTLSFLHGVGHLIDLEFFSITSGIALMALLLVDYFQGQKRSFRMSSWIGIGIFMLFFVVVPMIGIMSIRHSDDGAKVTHDNVIQMEEAANFLRQGKNPYAEDYFNTPLAQYGDGKVYGITNPALFHLINLPGHVVLTTLLSTASLHLFGYYDERFLYFIAYIGLIILCSRLGRTEVEKQRSIILVAFNPLLVPFMLEGRNDVLLLTVLLAACIALYKKRYIWAAGIFGFACTLKAFAWLLIPIFVIALVAKSGSTWTERMRRIWIPITVGVSIFLAVTLPFFIWNPHAFINDVIQYPGGGLATSYPIAGSGIGTNLLILGIIKNQTDMFPFWALQAATVLPLIGVFAYHLYRKPKISLLIFSGALLIFTNQYFGRYFHANHFGFVLALVAIAYGFMHLERSNDSTT